MTCQRKPGAAAGHSRYRRLCAGRRAAPGSGKLSTSCRRTNRRSAQPEGGRRLSEAAPASSNSIPTARRQRCARRSPSRTGSMPSASSAARAPTRSCSFSPMAYLGPGDEAIYTAARISRLSDRHQGQRRHAGRGAGDAIITPMSTRCSSAVTARTPHRLPRQSQQSDRHLSALRRGQAAACRACRELPAGARRGLCRICPAQRL